MDASNVTAELEAATARLTELEALYLDLFNSVDLFFVLAMGVICFLLQAGFGLLEAGSVRAKNGQNIMIKNIMDAVVTAIIYYAIGYSVSYGATGNGFIGGTSLMFLREISTVDYIYWYFNYVFAGTTATIVSGAVAERCQFRAYMVYSTALSGFIYPVCAHWIWDGSGFLNGRVYDFAGGGAVHMVGGIAAGVGAYVLGPRTGKFVIDPETGKKVAVNIPGHNMVLAALGALILWFGFFAFNGGSSYTIAGEAQFDAVGRAIVCTTLGGACGAVTLMIWGYIVTKSWDMGFIINGLLAGMVVICSGANSMQPWAACIAGVFGAIVCQCQIWIFENILYIDDPLGASAVHLGAGGAGMIWVAFFADPDLTGDDWAGLLYGGSISFLGNQLLGMAAYSAWAGGLSFIMFKGLMVAGCFRVDEAEELEGMDKSHHGGYAYPVDDKHNDETINNPSSDGESYNDKHSIENEIEEPAIET